MDSNHRPPHCKSGLLPLKYSDTNLVAREGIEPSCPAHQAGVFPLYDPAIGWERRDRTADAQGFNLPLYLLSYLPKHGYGARIRTQTCEVQSLACCRYTTPQQNWWPRSDSNRHYSAFETAASAIWATGLQLVPKEGVEPSREMAVVSKTTVSASSTTSAFILCKKKASFLLTESLEEGRGFEPLSLTGQRFSRPPHYLTLPTFPGWAGRNRTLASRFKRPLHHHSATTQDGPGDLLDSHLPTSHVPG